jgi:hypothetical protein
MDSFSLRFWQYQGVVPSEIGGPVFEVVRVADWGDPKSIAGRNNLVQARLFNLKGQIFDQKRIKPPVSFLLSYPKRQTHKDRTDE